MALTRQQKQKIIEYLEKRVDKQKIMIFADFTGLKVKDFSNLRKKIKASGDELKVVKKTLLERVFKNKDVKTNIKELKGEMAIVFGFGNEVLPAKTIYQFSGENPNLKILGGIFENKFRTAEDIMTLAKLSSKEEVFTKLVWSLQSPITNFLNVLQGNIKGLLFVLAKAKT